MVAGAVGGREASPTLGAPPALSGFSWAAASVVVCSVCASSAVWLYSAAATRESVVAPSRVVTAWRDPAGVCDAAVLTTRPAAAFAIPWLSTCALALVATSLAAADVFMATPAAASVAVGVVFTAFAVAGLAESDAAAVASGSRAVDLSGP